MPHRGRSLSDLMRYGYIAGLIFLSWSITEVKRSIHDYRRETFIPRFNSWFFHGGSERLYASKVVDSSQPNLEDKPLNGKSFIRSRSGPKPTISMIQSLEV